LFLPLSAKVWWARLDSNQGPTDYELGSGIIPAIPELRLSPSEAVPEKSHYPELLGTSFILAVLLSPWRHKTDDAVVTLEFCGNEYG